MIKKRISVTVLIPDVGATDEQVKEFIKYETCQISSISLNNPLHVYALFEDSEDLEMHD